MILKKLILKNFKSHKYTDIDFTKGITVIVGENGAGKSSILEGITYALFKKSNMNQNDLIRKDNDNLIMSVTLYFEENGICYKVVRKNSTKSASFLYVKNKNKFSLLAEGNTEVNNELKSIINMDIDLFLNAIYIKQGEIADLVSKKPSERKKLIGKFLKIEDLERAWEKLPKVINVYEKKQEKFKGMIINENDVQLELKKSKDELNTLKIKLNDYEETKNQYENQRKNFLKDKEFIEKQKSNHMILRNSIDNEKLGLKKLKISKEQIEDEYNSILKYENEFKILDEKISSFEDKSYDDMIIELKSENRTLKNENKSLEKSLDELSKVQMLCPVCQSYIDDDKKEKLIEGYNDTLIENDNKIDENLDLIVEYERKNNEIKKYKSRYIELKTLIKDKNEIQKQIKNLESNIETKTKNIKDLEKDFNEHKYDDSEYRNVLDKIKSLDGNITEYFEKIGITKGKISNTESYITKLENDLNNFENVKKDIENLKLFIDLLQELRFSYSRDGIQNDLRKISKVMIQKNTNMFFEKFNFDYSNLVINDDFEVSLFRNDEEVSMDMTSGGEKISIAIALRLGITQTIAQGNIDCMFLDEPTIHLDDVRVEELNNLLNNMDIIPQMIIVTHNQKLESLADVLMKVEKNNGISKVIM